MSFAHLQRMKSSAQANGSGGVEQAPIKSPNSPLLPVFAKGGGPQNRGIFLTLF
jgi:hypothetical protein